jgi:PTH1 family peptidyl-tRNA hydrolase
MNLSGDAVAPYSRYRNIAPEEILVVCDDANLPMGRLRLRSKGSAGGQKGLLSIIQQLHTDAFGRLRIGIDPGEPIHDLTDYVLTPWWGETRESMQIVLEGAADAVEQAVGTGLDATMSEFNGRDFFNPGV